MKTIASLLALVVLAGCADSSEGTEDQEAKAEAAVTWPKGMWTWTETSAGDTRSEQYQLDDDGTARHGTQFRSLWVDYNLADEDNDDYGRWSARGSVLQVIGRKIPLVTTPNCRLLDIGGKLFAHSGAVDDCPGGAPAITDAEAPLVGAWKLVEAATDTSPRTVQRLVLQDDRTLSLTTDTDGYDSQSLVGYWIVDETGTLHTTLPDGTEVLTGDVTTSGRSLRFCVDGDCAALFPDK